MVCTRAAIHRMRRGTHENRRRTNSNPYSQRGGSTGIPAATIWLPILSQRLGIKTKQQQELFLVACLLLILAIWFLTPLSDYIATFVLWTVPVESDVALDKEALTSLEHTYPRVVDGWGVRQIGMELIKSSSYVATNQQQQCGSFNNIQHYTWDFGVVHAPIVNAFALPGGIVRVSVITITSIPCCPAISRVTRNVGFGSVIASHPSPHPSSTTVPSASRLRTCCPGALMVATRTC